MDIFKDIAAENERLRRQLSEAMKLLGQLGDIYSAVLRENAYSARVITGKLMHEARSLENEIAVSERRHNNG